MLEKYLGVKNSTRNLSDTEFESILPQLAIELSSVNYETNYTDAVLHKEWKNLLEFSNTTNISSFCPLWN